MKQKNKQELPWVEVVIKALEKLGGVGELQDIYNKVAEMGLRDMSHLKKENVLLRTNIYEHSSDSAKFNGNPDKDYFRKVGNGCWGLRGCTSIPITEDDEGFPEGKKKLKIHVCRERNYKVIKEAKSRYKEKNGKLKCEICEFDFEDRYGEIGKDFIEGHHVIPVSKLKEGDKTKVEDIILVCSNCHKMLHRKRPWLNPDDLGKLIK